MLYVSDFAGNAIRRYDALSGAFIDTFANLNTPLILNWDLDGDLLVSSHADSMIWEYDLATGNRTPALSGGPVNCPVGHLFVDGQLIVASWQNNRILRYSDDGTFLATFAIGQGLQLPNDLLLRPIPEPSGLALLIAGIWIIVRARRK